MKRFGRITILILCATVCLNGCAGGGGNEKESAPKSLKIGISVYDQYDTFIGSLVDYFKAVAKEKSQETGMSITLEVVSAGSKQIVQNDQVTDFINSGCDILCINLVDRTDATMIIDKAKNADVPVIFFNRELVQEDLERWDKLYYVGAVALESGIMEGEIVSELCANGKDISKYDKNQDGKLQYVMLEGEAGHQDALVRTEYAIKTITKSDIMLEKLADEIANWKRDQGKTKMNLWLDEFGNRIELVLSNNDDMALGAIDAWKESGRNDWPIIVGIDGTEPALEAVKEGTLSGTVLNDAKGQAKNMLELAYSLHFKTELPYNVELENDTYIRLPHKIVTPDNIEEVLQEK